MAVEFRLLGSVEAWLDGRRVDTGPARQRCVLAALLVQADQPLTADELVERVWGDRVPHRARETLRSYLSRLRPVLTTGGVDIARHSGGYVLTADPATVDLHRFRDLVGHARTAPDDAALTLFDRALGLWRGEALAGLDTPWVNAVRATLDAERVAAELDHVDLRLRCGHHGDLLATLTTRAAERPLDERLARQLILALYRSGRQADALDAYRRIRHRLTGELGVDPSPPLQELYQRILASDPALAVPRPAPAEPPAPRPRQLPGSIPNFVGRGTELDLLTAQLDAAGRGSGTVLITSISGTPGIGKTSLAVHWARRNIDRFPDGQLYVNLRGFDPSGTPVSPAEAVRGFLDAFQVPAQNVPADLEAQAALYRSLVDGKRMVIVLDNARDTDQVRPLLPGGPSCLVVVTSRHQLTGLVVRDHARRITLDMLTTDEARELLATFLGRERVAAETDAVEEVIRQCAHLPLALSIAAARAGTNPSLPLGALVAELRRDQHKLTALSTRDSVDTDLRAVFSWSYQALSPSAARLFRLLGLHPGPEIALATAACLADLPEDQARESLLELTQANLLNRHEADRFQSHDLLRAYAGELTRSVDTDAERRAATQRYLDYYLHAAALAMAEIDPRGSQVAPDPDRRPRHLPVFRDHAEAAEWLEAEYRNLLVVITDAARRGWYDHAWQLPHLLEYFFTIRGRSQDSISTCQIALDAARLLDDKHAQAETLKNLGIAYWQVTRSEEALECNREALALFREAGNPGGEGDVLNNLGLVHERIGQYDQALDRYSQALPLRLAVGNRRGEAATLQNLGNVYDVVGRYDEAVSHYHRALAIFRDIGEQRGQAIVLGNLGIVHERLGQYDEAVQSFQQCNALIDKTGDQWVAGSFMTALGNVYRKLGRHAEAVEQQRQALELIREIGDRGTESQVLNDLGDTHLAMGHREQALTHYQHALALALDVGRRHQEAHAHDGIGHALPATDPDVTRHHWQEALTIYEELGVPEAEQVRRRLDQLGGPAS